MRYDPGFNIKYDTSTMTYQYEEGVFGPPVEERRLEDIRPSLLNPDCDGPETVYSIAMDVGRIEDQADLIKRNLLYGTVIYAKGTLGDEPIRSQGHIHAVSESCGMSTPEVYEIWTGKAYIYMQERATDHPGRCYAVEGNPGDVIVVPPGWAHATISADPKQPLVFGAWCVRDYGFDYKDVRDHKGLAFFPKINSNQEIIWEKNPLYDDCQLDIKKPRYYEELNIEKGIPIYTQYLKDPNRFAFVANPKTKEEVWKKFIP